ncbi:Murein DD-endopeptidase MepM and murein hydrolase activator NlpD, contain LysM domain [Marininema mesophilum]|uniref:Murein DD-endopeptidase MepM and murein hydrolase activator NlpD, contain LysM domain n=1 Tax=Marininema mesophilum TaxID=1048340 RepID=A0A1H2X551_9BACL|nr:peptidoglycan DD-metalloendopeptidase family protein [Marininema mesophilum]SDW87945.1 Murein DD-endopeptidase MepM and murein hydrolase activator NlpD, contain LysM domain [Marininema mesophilum]
MRSTIKGLLVMLRQREGAATVEFVTILPLTLILSFVIWQFAIFGLAIMDTHSAIRDAVKVASLTGDAELAEKEGTSSFGKSEGYKLKKLKVKIKNGEVTAKANTDIPILFMDTKAYTYSSDSDAPLLNSAASFGGDVGVGVGKRAGGAFLGGSVLPGGRLATPIPAPPGCGMSCYSGHTGQDFPAPIGTPIKAAEDGKVVKVINLGDRSYGTYVVIDHGNGVQTLYAHMYSDQPVVKVGDEVKKGQKIGESGNNGNSRGPHLHFEVKIGGRPVDPVAFLK